MSGSRIVSTVTSFIAAAVIGLAVAPAWAEDGIAAGTQLATNPGDVDPDVEERLFTLQELGFAVESLAFQDAEWDLFEGLESMTFQSMGQ